MTTTYLLTGATGTTTGLPYDICSAYRTYQATVSGTGAVTATVVIEGSADGVNYLTLGTITLSGTTSATDGFVSQAKWAAVRAKVTAITGTGAAVNAVVGY